MASPAETAARTYVAAWQEPDPAARARLIEACFAEDGRIVMGTRTLRGRAGLAKEMDDFFADPRRLAARLVTAIDARGALFRFRAEVVDADGKVVFEGLDTAEVDGDGRIVVLLTFGGPDVR